MPDISIDIGDAIVAFQFVTNNDEVTKSMQ